MDDPDALTGDDPVAAYKRLLRTLLDRRPSGARQRIARVIGTNKSFVSQITNPAYRVPLPAQHVNTIIEVCHFSREERERFLAAYRAAHPGADLGPARIDEPAIRGLWIDLPEDLGPAEARRLEALVRDVAERIVRDAVAVRGGEPEEER